MRFVLFCFVLNVVVHYLKWLSTKMYHIPIYSFCCARAIQIPYTSFTHVPFSDNTPQLFARPANNCFRCKKKKHIHITNEQQQIGNSVNGKQIFSFHCLASALIRWYSRWKFRKCYFKHFVWINHLKCIIAIAVHSIPYNSYDFLMIIIENVSAQQETEIMMAYTVLSLFKIVSENSHLNNFVYVYCLVWSGLGPASMLIVSVIVVVTITFLWCCTKKTLFTSHYGMKQH